MAIAYGDFHKLKLNFKFYLVISSKLKAMANQNFTILYARYL